MPATRNTKNNLRSEFTNCIQTPNLRTVAMFIVIMLVAVLLYAVVAASRPISIDLDQHRNYKLAPFNLMDATQTCENQTRERIGSELIRTYTDEHSTRWEESSGLYKIFMVAYTGTHNDYKELAVHCYVDPKKHVLTHYRTIDQKKTSIISKAIKFFH